MRAHGFVLEFGESWRLDYSGVVTVVRSHGSSIIVEHFGKNLKQGGGMLGQLGLKIWVENWTLGFIVA